MATAAVTQKVELYTDITSLSCISPETYSYKEAHIEVSHEIRMLKGLKTFQSLLIKWKSARQLASPNSEDWTQGDWNQTTSPSAI